MNIISVLGVGVFVQYAGGVEPGDGGTKTTQLVRDSGKGELEFQTNKAMAAPFLVKACNMAIPERDVLCEAWDKWSNPVRNVL